MILIIVMIKMIQDAVDECTINWGKNVNFFTIIYMFSDECKNLKEASEYFENVSPLLKFSEKLYLK
jgi:hypothetical protein